MGLLSGIRTIRKPVFVCQRCGHCCSIEIPLFRPDLTSLSSQVNLSKLRSFVKVYLSPGEKPPNGIRLFLDAGDPDRLPGERARCPFLVGENSCSIYESRPIACRVFPFGQKVGGSCSYWNGRPDDEMIRAHKLFKEEEKKISKMGAENYYRRWLNLLYPKGYIRPSSIRKGIYWTENPR